MGINNFSHRFFVTVVFIYFINLYNAAKIINFKYQNLKL